MVNLEYLLALNQVYGLGPTRTKLLLEYFNDPKVAWEADVSDWQGIKVPVNVIKSWQDNKLKITPAEILEELSRSAIKVVTIYDDDYPKALKEIYDPPIVIYYQGDLGCLSKKGIGVVGTRKMTSYGEMVTEKFVANLAKAGLMIISGLARGVDTKAHQVAIESSGKTVAVLGGGLKKIFPSENKKLAEEIINGFGVVISEFLPDADSLPGNFPARNRIISGLSVGVLVTEAAEDSGSLITAKFALEQNREVFAIPGPITSDQSLGTLSLIKQGAKLVTDPIEILEELGIQKDQRIKDLQNQIQKIKLSKEEDEILMYLSRESQHIDQICRDLKLPASLVSSSLVKMEIYGLVKNLGAGIYLKLG